MMVMEKNMQTVQEPLVIRVHVAAHICSEVSSTSRHSVMCQKCFTQHYLTLAHTNFSCNSEICEHVHHCLFTLLNMDFTCWDGGVGLRGGGGGNWPNEEEHSRWR